MKRYLALFLLLFSVVPLLSNTFTAQTISGKIMDQDKKPVPFAVVTLLKASDSSLVKGATTDENGLFQLDNVVEGTYLLKASFTGYQEYIQGPLEFKADGELKLEDITLLPENSRDEVVFSAAKPLFTQRADMLIMNVENSPVRIMGTAWDLISTAPGVVIDQNNNISLRGKSGVQIYIDGRNTFLSGDQLVTYLQNISAADVVSVEIISNPSAKYDAAGTGGILNIVTRKGSQQGFNSTVRAGFGQAFYSKYEAGFNCNYAKEKFNIYAKYDFAQRNGIERSFINRNILYNNINTNYYQHTSMIDHPMGQNARLGVDFYGKHELTWGMRVDASLSDERNHSDNQTLIHATGNDTVTQLDQYNKTNVNFYNYGANLYLDKKIDTLGQEFSASADYLAYNTLTDENFDLNYSYGFGANLYPPEYQKSRSTGDIGIFVAQADYAHPFNKKYKLETGLKSSYVGTNNDLAFSNLNNGIWENDTTKSNAFIYKEQINAAYVTGYADWGKLQLQSGLRAEQTISDGDSPTTGQHLKKSYVQLFPSVFLLYKLNDKNSLNLTYARRVNRPDYQSLNPFVYYLDKYTYEVGNPYLQPEIANEMEFTYSYMDAAFVTVGGSITSNAMTDVTNQVDSTGVGFKTTVNLSTGESAYFGISCPIPIGKWFLMENEINLSYSKYHSPLYGSTLDIQSWMWNPSTNITIILPHEWKIQTWGWYQSPGTYAMFHTKSKAGVGCGLSKNCLNKQLQLSLNVQDIFSTNGMRATINYQNQDVYLEFIPESPRVFIRARYTFGNSKATRKAQTISGADDLKGRTGK
ncbi:MAG TPA: TonB-dependent receptor [Bacteroidia bacterium]|jgi:outer membrane receptor protein involved in Fe transport|nr:TonB-dependent receptor [Bacteroidia bacterium]